MGVERVVAEDVVPPVGVLRDDAQQILLAVAADHDRRRRVGPRLAVGVHDPVVLPLVAGRRVGPQAPDQLDRLGELGDAHAGGRQRPSVREILLVVPARPDAEDRPAARERLRGGDHLGQVRRVAEAVAQHFVAAPLVGIAGERPDQERPALGDLVAVVLDVVREPERVEGADRPIEVWEGRRDQARPDVEADGDGHAQNQLALSTTFRSGWPARKRRQLSSRISKRRSSRCGP